LRWGRLLSIALAGAALLPLACAGRAVEFEGADVSQGKQLFVKECGGCHVLADAATAGTIGPNLDDSFRAARSPSGGDFNESTFFQITLDQMRLAAPPMPHFDEEPQKLSEQELVDIAAYVAGVAGTEQPPAGGNTGTGTTGTGTTATGTSTSP
jgi:mono/diheme cytochrome c family protein